MNTLDNILQPVIVAMLKEIEKVLQQQGINFYLVGAMARDIQLAANPGSRAARATKDVDLAIMINSEEQFYKIKERLLATGSFIAHTTEPIKLFFQQRVELDLLPFGEIENESRETRITKPQAFVIDMPGFREVYSSVVPTSIDGITVNVCSLEGIVLLKLLAYEDRPSRTKDITDIEHIIEHYFELYSDEIYENYLDVLEQYDTAHTHYLPLIAARVIGRKMKVLLTDSPLILKRVEGILNKRPTTIWQAMFDGLGDE